MEPSFKFVRVRDVHVPTRANQGDAGMDFYVPNDLTVDDLIKCNTTTYVGSCSITDHIKVPSNEVYCLINEADNLFCILIGPHATCVIPSGICGI